MNEMRGDAVMEEYKQRAKEAANWLKERVSTIPKAGIVLGSGLGGMIQNLDDPEPFPYDQIPGYESSTAPGHKGELVFGKLAGVPVVLMNGRHHYYEGYSMKAITFPIRVLQMLGIEYLMITNAAGGLNPDFEVGRPMIINDHINMMNDNPLVGANIEEWGPRFPDMSSCYDQDLIETARDVAHQLSIPIYEGVYVGVSGPNFETPAELRMLRHMGADAVGMSTVPEVIVCAHSGIKVLGISAITDRAVPDDLKPLTAEEVLEIAKKTGLAISALLTGVIQKLVSESV